MPKTKYILFFFIFFTLFFQQANGQSRDTLAVMLLNKPMLLNNSLQFDIRLHNPTDKWLRFVSGTYQFTIPGLNLSYDDFFIQYIGNSDLNAVSIPGDDLPEDAYVIKPDLVGGDTGPSGEYRGRLSITVTGPDSSYDAVMIPKGDTITIGRFALRTQDADFIFPPDIQDHIIWLPPFDYYQACAYQTEMNIPVGPTNPNVIKYYIANNIEMEKYGKGIVKYDIFEGPEPCFELIDFRAEYKGAMQIEVNWSTNCEAYNDGFMLVRGLRYTIDQTCSSITFTDTVGRYDGASINDQHCIAKGGYYPGQGASYGTIKDMVQFRDIEYCYKLLHKDMNSGEWIVDTCSCVPVPHAVITYAQANPNPFSERTKIKYILEDDVMLTVKVIDITGKEIKYLEREDGTVLRKVRVNMGEHETIFMADDIAAQGLYDVIFLAIPINDPVYEFSRAVVKVQVLK